MNIHIHHTGSAGNLYQVDDLLLEAGVPVAEIKKSLNFRLSEITACLISHEHGDHAKGAEGLLKAGIDLYASKGTLKALCLGSHRTHTLEANRQVRIGEWRVLPFNVVHDAEEPLGFLLVKGGEKLFFATDTNYIPYQFEGLTHIMLGVDYDLEALRGNIAQGSIHPALGNRILKNHMSLQTGLGFFKANDMSRVEEIHILHLSETNSNEERFKAEIQKVTGRPVYIASPGRLKSALINHRQRSVRCNPTMKEEDPGDEKFDQHP